MYDIQRDAMYKCLRRRNVQDGGSVPWEDGWVGRGNLYWSWFGEGWEEYYTLVDFG